MNNKFSGYWRAIFDRIPDAPRGDCQFIELEDKFGKSTGDGKWVVRNVGPVLAELQIPAHPAMAIMYEALKEIGHRSTSSWTRNIVDNALDRVKRIEEGE